MPSRVLAAAWVAPTEKNDSADLLAFVMHATARGLHSEKEAEVAVGSTAAASKGGL